MYYDVNPESTSWALEGSGDARVLVVDLERAEAVDWDEGLFRVATADDTEPMPTIARNLQWTPAKAASVETPATEAHAASPEAASPSATATEAWCYKKALDDKYKAVMAILACDKDDSKREDAQGIWADLMSGKKRLLT